MLKLSVFLTTLMLSLPVFAISISTTDFDYPTLSTLTTAGEYYDTSFESSSSAATLSISAAPGTPSADNSECGATNPAWKISAWLSTSVTGLTIQVKRVGNGSGGSLTGGDTYLTLNTAAQTFFCGSGDISSIGLQFQVTDFSEADGNGTDTWAIRYTVETL